MTSEKRPMCAFCGTIHTEHVWAESSEDIEAYQCACGAVWYAGMPDSKEEALPDD
jgi:hypothetical protein